MLIGQLQIKFIVKVYSLQLKTLDNVFSAAFTLANQTTQNLAFPTL